MSDNSKNIDLRGQIESFVARAIDSTINYSGGEYEQNKQNWLQITTDRIVASIMNSLPEPIDTRAKYETDGINGIFIDDEPDNTQLDLLAGYSHDQGFNHYYFQYTDYLRALYTIQQGVVQSGNEQYSEERRSTSGPQQEDPNEPDNQEPSKVR